MRKLGLKFCSKEGRGEAEEMECRVHWATGGAAEEPVCAGGPPQSELGTQHRTWCISSFLASLSVSLGSRGYVILLVDQLKVVAILALCLFVDALPAS